MSVTGGLFADCAMWTNVVVVSTPSLALLCRKAHEPLRVEALRTELAVERLDERVVRWFTGP